MKKIILVFVILSIFSLSLVSAGWWDNVWNKWTGGEDDILLSPCTDSDNGQNLNIKGYTESGAGTNWDYCNGAQVREYYCTGNSQNAVQSFSCPSGQTCSDGRCITGSACTDSDNGQNLNIKGYTESGAGTNWDYCNGAQVREYYCTGNSQNAVQSFSCPSGQTCSDGRCIGEAPTCSDGDDGQNVNIKSSTTDNTGTQTDSCYSSDRVYERYCTGSGTKATTLLDCPTGETCSDGRCIISGGCIDSDGGQDLSVKGFTESGAGVNWDYCSGAQVREHYCTGNFNTVNAFSCPSGESCSDGRCAPASNSITEDVTETKETTDDTATPECSETDSGLDIYNLGTTSAGETVQPDECMDDSSLKEYFCSAQSVDFEVIPCPNGYECSSGKCLPSNVGSRIIDFFARLFGAR